MKHCKGCIKISKEGTGGPWCCKYGRLAKKAVGHCKLNNGKTLGGAVR